MLQKTDQRRRRFEKTRAKMCTASTFKSPFALTDCPPDSALNATFKSLTRNCEIYTWISSGHQNPSQDPPEMCIHYLHFKLSAIKFRNRLFFTHDGCPIQTVLHLSMTDIPLIVFLTTSLFKRKSWFKLLHSISCSILWKLRWITLVERLLNFTNEHVSIDLYF